MDYLDARGSFDTYSGDTSFGASVSGYGVGLSFSAKYSSSTDQEQSNMRNFFADRLVEVVMSRASCRTNGVKLSVEYARVLFSPDFITAIQDLNNTLSQSQEDQDTEVNVAHTGKPFLKS